MRSIKELLQVMLDNKRFFRHGLCYFISVLFEKDLINFEEHELLRKYINENRPRQKWYDPYMLFNKNPRYYWIMDKITPRIKWIKYHISIN